MMHPRLIYRHFISLFSFIPPRTTQQGADRQELGVPGLGLRGPARGDRGCGRPVGVAVGKSSVILLTLSHRRY